MRLSFHGADRGVTGSCHMLEAAGKRLLVDCGLYQGSRELDEENADPFGFDPAAVDILLLTHAHLDHCGRIPLLVKRGFAGEIIATAATRELARLVLLDAAHLQEEDARRQASRSARSGTRRNGVPLYSMLDALTALDRFGRVANYDQAIPLAAGLEVTYRDAGHILGSAFLQVDAREAGAECRVLFSGDLGSSGRPLLRDPETPHKADAVVMETTYGDRNHRSLDDSVEELYAAISGTLERGGNVIIPTFALERAQEVLFYLASGVEKGRLRKNLRVFLDSPMAISATEIFRRHPECYDAEQAARFRAGSDPFALPGLSFVHDAAESMALNRLTGGAVIMAGSGMCTGGRVRHHLKHNLWRREASVVFVGYAAQGTLAREIIDGAERVRVFGEDIAVQARVYTINGFSAHAGQAELLAWHAAIAPSRTFLVHGEEQATRQFGALLKGTEVTLPALGEAFDLRRAAT
jgi:metallo-beta-lactamase family protein